MSAEDLANDAWNDEAEDVLTQHWNLRARLCPVSVAVNRRVWRVEDSFLAGSWSDDRPGVQRELELCRALTNSPRFSFAVPTPILTSNGAKLLELGSRLWWRTAALSGSHPEPTDREQVLAVARDLARLHAELAASGVKATVQQVPFHEWPSRALAFVRDHPEALPAADRLVVERAVAAAEHIQDHLSDSQLVHGDPSFPNLLCANSPDGLRLVGILDWQEAAIDSLLTDLSVLGTTVWFRSNAEDPGELLRQALRAYEEAGGKPWPYPTVLLAILAAKLQSVAHHGSRYVAGKGPYALFSEQPRLLGLILDEMGTDQVRP
jgi:macrolide phosphotransferase